jgi:hypothetical protein
MISWQAFPQRVNVIGHITGDIARFWSKVREALDRLDANTTTDGWSI